MYRFVLLTLFALSLIGCEKKVEFNLKDASELLTVDASIETGQDPVVILTKSLNYFSKITVQIRFDSKLKKTFFTLNFSIFLVSSHLFPYVDSNVVSRFIAHSLNYWFFGPKIKIFFP